MVIDMEFIELKEKEFDSFARNHKYSSFLQSVEEYHIKKEEGYDCYLVGVKHEDTLIAATFLQSMPVARFFRYFYAPRGFLMDYEDKELMDFFFSHLKKYLYDHKCLYLKFDPYVPLIQRDKNGEIVKDGFDHHDYIDALLRQGCKHGGFTTGFNAVSQARWMMVLDLKNKTEEDLIKNMDQLRKRIIKKVDSNHVVVSFLSHDELPLYEKVVEETGKRKGFLAREHSYHEHLYHFFGEDQIKIAYAQLDVKGYMKEQTQKVEEAMSKFHKLKSEYDEKPTEKLKKKMELSAETLENTKKKRSEAEVLLNQGEWIPLASCFFILYGKEIVYLSGGSYHEYNKYNGPYTIQWNMIRYALSHGYTSYNFYGTSGKFHKDADDYGVYEFKRGFNAEAVELLGDFYLPIRKGCFSVYNRLKHIV